MQREIVKLKGIIVNRIIVLTIIFLSITYLFSLLRVFEFGWQNIFVYHTFGYMSMLVLTLLRDRIKYWVKVVAILFIYTAVGVLGILNFATGGGYYYVIIVFAILAILVKRKYALYFLAGIFIIYSLIAYGYFKGYINPIVNFNSIYKLPFHWVTQLLTMFAISVIFIYGLGNFYKKLVLTIEDKNKAYDILKEHELEYSNFIKYSFTGICKMRFKTPLSTYLDIEQQIDKCLNELYIIECNDQYAKQFGYQNSSEIIGMTIRDYWGDDQDARNNAKLYIESNYVWRNVEIFRVSESGDDIYTQNNIRSIIVNNEVTSLWIISMDISDLKVLQKELEKKNEEITINKERYQSIYTGSIDGFIYVDNDMRIVDCNQSFLDIIGYSMAELKGRDYKVSLESGYDWDTFIQDLASMDRPNNTAELDIIHKNGSRIPAEATIHKAVDGEESYLWAVVRDLRDKKNLEKKVFKTMICSEEKERERYAKELHDGLGPLLSTGMIYVNAITNEKDIDIKDSYAVRAYEIFNETTGAVKEISNNLSPLILREYGIPQAIRAFIEKTKGATNINFTINSNLKKRFNELVEITLYRILAELINNSIKYSRAQDIKIVFCYESNIINLQYNDNGDGFDYEKAIANQTGFGLLNLENRIKKLGGRYNYFTSSGKGVSVNIELQIEQI